MMRRTFVISNTSTTTWGTRVVLEKKNYTMLRLHTGKQTPAAAAEGQLQGKKEFAATRLLAVGMETLTKTL